MLQEMKRKNAKTLNWLHLSNIVRKFPHIKRFMAFFLSNIKTETVCHVFNSLWKMGTFWWTANPSLKDFEVYKSSAHRGEGVGGGKACK